MLSSVSLRSASGDFHIAERRSTPNGTPLVLNSLDQALSFLRQFASDGSAVSSLRRLLHEASPATAHSMDNRVVLSQVARLVSSGRVVVVRKAGAKAAAETNYDWGGREGRGREYSNLPDRLRARVLRLGKEIRDSGDENLLHQYEHWTITYKDVEKWKTGRDEVYGETLFPTQTTTFFKGTHKLDSGELYFAVAHEFRHLARENNSIGGGSGMGGFLSGQSQLAERDANQWAATFLKTEIPTKFKDYGTKY